LILAGYTVLIGGVMLKPSKPAAAPVAAAPVAASSGSSDIPSVDDEAFGTFIEDETNLNSWLATAEE
jgi:hypothetical protein